MAAEYVILENDIKNGEFVSFGPVDPDTEWQLKIPKTFSRTVSYKKLGIEAEIAFRFTGEKVVIDFLAVNSKPQPVTSRSLTQLCLPEITYEVTKKVVPESDRWALKTKKERAKYGKVNSKSPFLAQIYWLEQVAGGKPRVAIMEYMNAPRPTVNDWLRDLKTSGFID